MEAYDLLSCSPTQVMKNSQELEGAEGVGLKSRERQVCRIAFEGYLSNRDLLHGAGMLSSHAR